MSPSLPQLNLKTSSAAKTRPIHQKKKRRAYTSTHAPAHTNQFTSAKHTAHAKSVGRNMKEPRTTNNGTTPALLNIMNTAHRLSIRTTLRSSITCKTRRKDASRITSKSGKRLRFVGTTAGQAKA